MLKKKLIAAWAMLVLLALGTCGCAVVGTAIGAGAAYGIYQLTK